MEYPEVPVRTINELLDHGEKEFGSLYLFRWQEKDDIRSVTYAEFAKEVRALSAYFAGNTSRDAHIAVLGSNSYAWLLGWFGAVCAGRLAVPLDPQLPTADLLGLLEKSDTELLLYADDFDDVAQAFPHATMRLEDLPAAGDAEGWPCEVQPDDIGMIVFTSGTTGKPKGVMLSHWNFLSNALAAYRFGAKHLEFSGPGHVCVCVLPFYHTASLNCSLISLMPMGSTMCLNAGLKTILKDFEIFQPDCIFLVPLLAEGIYKRIWDTAKKEGKDKLLRVMLRVSDFLFKLGIDLRRRLFKTVLNTFGGKMRWMLTGAAPISDECVAGFYRFGIDVLHSCGATECSPGISLCRFRRDFIKPGSVGQILDCQEVRIVDGEIQVKGDNVFKSYYKDEEATREAFTEDGWYKTADLGHIDEDGFLYMTGRIKNLIVLGNGKNVSPEPLEQKLTDIPYIKEALVYDAGGEIAAELFLDEEVPDAAERLEGDLLELNRQLPVFQRITKTTLRDTEFPKTTTKKIKRK